MKTKLHIMMTAKTVHNDENKKLHNDDNKNFT